MNENIVITGFTSCGKSAAGRIVAERLSYHFVDLDSLIESVYSAETQLHHTCREIVTLHGRNFFDTLETQALSILTGRKRIVAAPGGGVLLRTESRGLLRQVGTIFYLATAPDIIFERMSKKGFPAYLDNDHSFANVAHHWEMRKKLYEKNCRYQIDNSHLTPDQTADAIIVLWNTHQTAGV